MNRHPSSCLIGFGEVCGQKGGTTTLMLWISSKPGTRGRRLCSWGADSGFGRGHRAGSKGRGLIDVRTAEGPYACRV